MMEEEKLMRGDQTSFYSLMRKRCINQKDFSDITFVVGSLKQTIAAHRCILAARSEVFRSMFVQQSIHATGDQEVPYVLADVRPEVFLTTLDYMYTNCCTLTPNLAPDVLAMSIDYGLDGLRRLSVRYMLDSMVVDSVCSVLQSAVIHGQEEILQRALSFIEANTREVLATTQFLELSEQSLSVILRSENIEADEIDILHAVRRWSSANHVVSGKPMSQLAAPIIGLVRLPLLSAEELSKVEDDNREEKVIPVQQLAAAWRFHALKENAPPSVMVRPRKGTKERDTHQYLVNN
ncbi:BTB/POZ domain-containing protein 19-like [Styela clava]